MSARGRSAASWAGPVAAVVGVLIVLVAIGGGRRSTDRPLDPRSDSELGTSALVALAEDLGADVDVVDGLPDVDDQNGPDVFLVFADLLAAEQHDRLQGWVEAGGTLVVTDPSSSFAPDVVGDFRRGELPGDPVDRGGPGGYCDIPALADLATDRIAPRDGGSLFEVPAGWRGCVVAPDAGVGGDDAAYIVTREQGAGDVVVVGGSGLFTNVSLDEGENAPVVAALVVPRAGTRLAVLRPGPVSGEGDESLVDLIAPNVRAALVQLVVAFVLYAVWRARRLGAPVREPQPVAVAGSELVAATGSLLDRSGSPEHAAALLRADLRRFLADRLGVPADSSPDVLAAVAAERAGVDPTRVTWALGPTPVADDAELVALALTIDAVRTEVLAHV
ncbi:MAG TPA: DUF4350 domain-containing protein [Acidimicrobiales bacterium]